MIGGGTLTKQIAGYMARTGFDAHDVESPRGAGRGGWEHCRVHFESAARSRQHPQEACEPVIFEPRICSNRENAGAMP
jgi:hypothetical protein